MVFAVILLSLLSLSAAFVEIPPSVIEAGPTKAPLGCHRRLYSYRVTQADSQGRECWDNVSVWSCWGRCDSNEISDWKFPYKKSHHPVCVHSGKVKAVAVLRNCHPQAEPEAKRYEYMEAKACSCQTCSSTETNSIAYHFSPQFEFFS